jgi:hypothetical protein
MRIGFAAFGPVYSRRLSDKATTHASIPFARTVATNPNPFVSRIGAKVNDGKKIGSAGIARIASSASAAPAPAQFRKAAEPSHRARVSGVQTGGQIG